MRQVNIHEAKTRLSSLIDEVEHGEEVIIARHNRPVARLVLFTPQVRKPGSMKGCITIHDDFDAPLPDGVLDDFEGIPK
ncbi:MAG: type II toxin-antitoxin system Phd/YefM family antitoxin [Mariprofundaceae bacterium]|nr:type II toxin-antitoxin system Phd/YefM family antitoxin [Mariprofundaceae bacterium]